MSEAWRPLRRTLVWAAALLVIDVGGARALDGMNVADRLLSGGVGAIGWLPLIVVFFAARLLLHWVTPGLLIRAVVLGLAEKRWPTR